VCQTGLQPPFDVVKTVVDADWEGDILSYQVQGSIRPTIPLGRAMPSLAPQAQTEMQLLYVEHHPNKSHSDKAISRVFEETRIGTSGW